MVIVLLLIALVLALLSGSFFMITVFYKCTEDHEIPEKELKRLRKKIGELSSDKQKSKKRRS